MYLLHWNEDTGVVEASLGGRVTPLEMKVLGEEMLSLLVHLDEPCEVILDYSKALPFEDQTYYVLGEIKDRWLELGADRIVSIPQEDTELGEHITPRIQHVLEGREEFVRDVPKVSRVQRQPNQLRLAA